MHYRICSNHESDNCYFLDRCVWLFNRCNMPWGLVQVIDILSGPGIRAHNSEIIQSVQLLMHESTKT